MSAPVKVANVVVLLAGTIINHKKAKGIVASDRWSRMIEFTLSACLINEPERCRTGTQLFTEMTLIQCMTSAQFVAVDWLADNPGWQVRPYRYEILDQSEARL